MTDTTDPRAVNEIIIPCAAKGCTAKAAYFPTIREKGRNAVGVVVSLPLCAGCSGALKVADLVTPESFPTIKSTLKAAGQFVGSCDDLEVVRIHIDSPEAGPFRKKIG